MTTTSTHAVRVHHTGGPEELRWEKLELAPLAAGEVRLRHTAIGLNFLDTYHRSGLYPMPLPAVLGSEAAGVVEAVGEGVTAVQKGDRVGYATGPTGAYAEARNIAASFLVKLPDAIDDVTAAASLLKGMTAHFLCRRTYVVQKDDVVLVHAAAGGVGLILCQWLKSLGATVIGTVGSEEKAKLAYAHGCDHVLFYRTEDVAVRVREITAGARVPVVYDSVGRDTFLTSLDCLRPRGLMVTFGNSSGPVGPIDPRLLATKGSLFLTRPTLTDHVRERADLDAAVKDLFAVIASKAVRVEVAQTYPLRDAERAHRDLEARKTTGSTVLLP